MALTAKRKEGLTTMEMGAFMQQTGNVKVFAQKQFRVADRTYLIYRDPDDSEYDQKEAGIHLAVSTVDGNGFGIPDGLRFYCTGNRIVQNRTYHRDAGWNKVAWITIGSTAVTGTGRGAMSSMPNPGFTPVSVTCIHEIGHNLHEKSAGDTFWEMSGNANSASEVSSYAQSNKKEFVAEVFAGLNVGRTFSTKVINEYKQLGGPTSPILPR